MNYYKISTKNIINRIDGDAKLCRRRTEMSVEDIDDWLNFRVIFFFINSSLSCPSLRAIPLFFSSPVLY